MTDRRFNEEEVAAIFQRATETQSAPQRDLPAGGGLTLAELHEIGRQVGIVPESVTRAAASIARGGNETSRRFLGLPIGVGRIVELDRKISDDEWERLVVDLRETFDARGTIKQEGGFRQWTNGNLQILLEPGAYGHRIRFRTFRGDAQAWMMGGLAVLGVWAATAIAAMAGSSDVVHLSPRVELLVVGLGVFAIGALRLPGWSRLRRKQMAEIAGRLTVSMAPGTGSDGGS